ncbi:MAG: S-layer homology domain-containing protein, partial [Candidatus Magasanikbacteria bacterium]|nr:S-layer homology domain-containing protein [Candidatus Magasanikbacteria bacterium]
ACGDGILNITAGETCDDGLNNGIFGSCNLTCDGETPSVCGNSVTEGVEICDDGPGNGTPNNCNSECSGMTASACGNGETEFDEACDGGGVDTEFCNANCTSASCGDGYLNGAVPEACDDGNPFDGDGCSSSCQIEDNTPPMVTPLGDGDTIYELPSTCPSTACNRGDIYGAVLNFSEELSADGKTAVENAITNGASVAPRTYVWSGTRVRIYATEPVSFLNDVVADVEDLNGATAEGLLLIDSSGGSVCGNDQCEVGENPFVCPADCFFEGGFTCGNATAEGDNPVEGGMGEPCDGADLRNYTCDSLPGAPFTGGTLACNENCMSFDTSACTGGGEGQGGQCILENSALDGTNPFDGGQGEVCDGETFRQGHSACTDFGYSGGELTCDNCNFNFSGCTGGGGGGQSGGGQITVNLKNEDGDPYLAPVGGVMVTAACGDTAVQMHQGGEQGPPPTREESFFSGAMIAEGESSATIMGIPTPEKGEAFSNPCLVFLGQGGSLSLGSQYAYTGGLNPVDWTDYSLNDTFDKPMPPMAKYAPVSLGDAPDNAADLSLKVLALTSGNLSGYICTDSNSSDSCDEGDVFLSGMSISVFPLGPMPAGFTMPSPYLTDGGYYEFNSLPGGDYIIEAFGSQTFFGMVSVSGDTTQDLVISLGGTLTLNLDNTSGCWATDEGEVHYSFWPQEWNFNSRPVFGKTAYADFSHDGDVHTLSIQGFSSGTYNGFIEIPGCLNVTGTEVDLGDSDQLDVTLDGGIVVSGKVVTDPDDPDNTGVANFEFGAQTVFDPESPMTFGNFVGTRTNGTGGFELRGLATGEWTFESFEGGLSTQRSFAAGQGSLNDDGVYTVDADGANNVLLVLRQDKRVNITVTDGVNLVTDAMIDIQCDTGKYVHLGHSNGVYAFLPPMDTCNFNVHSRRGSYQPLMDYPVAILAGIQPQNVTVALNSYNTNHGLYTGSTFKSDKTTTNPGGTVNYVGHAYSQNAANLAGRTVTFTYPAGSASGVAVSSPAGSCNTATDGVVTCAIPGGYAGTSYDMKVALTVDSANQESSISTAFDIAGTNVGNVFVEIVQLSIEAPGMVDVSTDFTVYGSAYPDATVTLSYLDEDSVETTVSSTVMEPGSNWYSFSPVNIDVAGDYTLKATAVGQGVSASVTRPITVGGATPKITGKTFTTNGGAWANNPNTGNPAGQIFEGNPFTLVLNFDGAVTGVIGSFQGIPYDLVNTGGNQWTLDISWGWTGYGNSPIDVNYTWDDDDNPATPDITIPYGPAAEPLVLIDPSGYVYDTTDANRIQNVNSTVYQLVAGTAHGTLAQGATITSVAGADDGTGGGTAANGIIENGEEGAVSGFAVGKVTGCGAAGVLDTTKCTWTQWNATPSGQLNPQLTDVNGKYGWNVPQGWYRVSFSKAGAYSTSYSRDIYVPPAETTLNLDIGAYDIGAPTVATNPANGATGIARNVNPIVVFSEPMLASTINTANIKLLDNDGGDANVPITITYNAANYTATLAPNTPPLAATRNYKIRVTTGVTDDSGNAFAVQVDNVFQTAAGTDVAAPASAATPASTTFTGSRTVTLGADDGGGAGSCTDCTIYYTTDGTIPTTSSFVYSGTLTFTSTKTLKFFARDAALNTEAPVKTETYTLTSAPAAPTGVTAANVAPSGYIGLNWSEVTGAASYKVYRTITSGSYGAALITGVTNLNYSDTAVANGTTYYYKVAATNAVGDSALSAEVSATSVVTEQQVTQQQQDIIGGGGETTGTNPPSNSNTETSTVFSKISEIVTGNQAYSRGVEIASNLITVAADGAKSAVLTSATGKMTLKPNSKSTVSASIPPSTTVQAPASWNGKISPPLVQSVSMISAGGEPIQGSKEKLKRDEVVSIVKVGSTNNVRLDFSHPVTMEVPVNLPDGSLITVLYSVDGKTWETMANATVKDRKVTFETTHFSYFTLTKSGKTVVITFKDIISHWGKAYIEELAGKGIIKGKTADKFAPNDMVTKAELVKIAVLAFNVQTPASVTKKPFTDVDVSVWYAPYIQAAKDARILTGSSKTKFKPGEPATRIEALKILLSASKAKLDPTATVKFKDAKAVAGYMKYLAYAVKNGIVSGYPDGTFKPGNPVTRAEAAKMTVKTMGLKK